MKRESMKNCIKLSNAFCNGNRIKQTQKQICSKELQRTKKPQWIEIF
jgi:hypothetical protein